MFTCPGCHAVDPKPTPSQHCRSCPQYHAWQVMEAFAPLRGPAKPPRTDGLCPDCGLEPKQPKSGYCPACRKKRDDEKYHQKKPKRVFEFGFCVTCGAPESRKGQNGGCLNCRARGRRMEYEAVKVAEGKTVKKMKRRVALEDVCVKQ